MDNSAKNICYGVDSKTGNKFQLNKTYKSPNLKISTKNHNYISDDTKCKLVNDRSLNKRAFCYLDNDKQRYLVAYSDMEEQVHED